jgi:hypothetical protein
MARLVTTLDAISGGDWTLDLVWAELPCRAASSVFERGAPLADRFENGLYSLIQLLEDVPLPLVQVDMASGRRSPESVRLATPYVQVRDLRS